MKLRKIMSGVIASFVAAAALAISSGAMLVVPENAPSYASFGTGNWMLKLYVPSEGIDLGIDLLAIDKVEVVLRPVDVDWWEGQTGGGLYMSCGPTSVTPADHNWVSQNFWGISDDAHELYTLDDTQPVQLETVGDYLYKGTLKVDDSNCFYQEVLDSPDGYVQLGVQEWGSDMSEVEVVSYTLYDASGAVLAEFDGNGNLTTSAASPAETEAAPAETEAAPAETEAAPAETTAAPAAGDVQAATTSSKGSPNTGIADVAAIAGLALVAGGAVVVAKKRK